MTKRSADERPKYITITLAVYENREETRIELVDKQPGLPETQSPQQRDETGPCGKAIHLNARTWYIWKRHGGVEPMLAMLADPDSCSQCDEQHTDANSYHGWFCYTCQRTLANLGLLPVGEPDDEREEQGPFVAAFNDESEPEL